MNDVPEQLLKDKKLNQIKTLFDKYQVLINVAHVHGATITVEAYGEHRIDLAIPPFCSKERDEFSKRIVDSLLSEFWKELRKIL